MAKIENTEQLRNEILRLKVLSQEKENKIRGDIRLLRESLKPANILLNTVESLTGLNLEKNDLLKNGLAFGVTLIFKKLISKTETGLENVISGWIEDLRHWVRKMINKIGND